jgi:outer membrane protein assembly factor BamB
MATTRSIRSISRTARAQALALGVLFALLVGLPAPPRAAADGPPAGAPWPQFKQGGTKASLATASGPFTPVQAWQFALGNPIIRGPVIGPDGVIYVGTENNRIHAIRKDGTFKWTFVVEGGGTLTHPIVNSRNQVVAGTEAGFVVGIKEDGTQAWLFDLASAPYSDGRVPFRSHPALSPLYPHLLIGADNGNVYELDEGGSFRGVRRARGPIRAGAAVTGEGTLVWASTDERAVYGGLAAGGDKWRVSLDGDVSSTPAVGADHTIYVATEAGSLYALTPATGAQRWRVKIDTARPLRSSPAVGPDGTVYIGTDEGRLFAISPQDGSVRWSYGAPGAITNAPAVGANGLIYVASSDGTVAVLNPRDGTVRATFRTNGPIDGSSPAIGADGTLYIGSRDGHLYALVEGAPTPTPAPAATPTPVPALPATPTPAPLPTDRVAPAPGALYFSETGHNVRGAFLTYFTSRGGLEQFGFPRTEEIVEDGRTVQYFQRARFEWFPEFAGTPYEVQLGLLGDMVTATRRPFPTGTPPAPGEDARFFPEVGHTVRGIFLRYFDEHGGLDRFGFPISEELREQNDDGTGRTYTVQYFQRARLEHHPELAGTPYEVQLGLLGDEVLRARGWLR